ncbi:hypothetical protein [Caulobacter phage Cr30]|uniref:hypothetical protein n=1 Tax=Caulobacter phage Cr30 TaxID=1357714 RepID=UPI0004A9B9F1|nr:hypothetical protein OZ74_gp056 [Caulobacter phage Cr30]AGS80941.1 hypothetical protein [Caulobacter phage Cr30]
MKVAELIERLKLFDQDLEVKAWDPERGIWQPVNNAYLETDFDNNTDKWVSV